MVMTFNLDINKKVNIIVCRYKNQKPPLIIILTIIVVSRLLESVIR